VKFITFTDVHISAHNPQSRVGSYQNDILDKLRQIGAVGKKIGVDFYLLAGDLFNLKYPMRNPHSLNTVLIETFKQYGAPVYATEGNHDLRNDSYATFDEQPLKVLYSSGALVQLRDVTIAEGDLRVGLRAFPFDENPDLSVLPKRPSDVDFSVAVLHLYASAKGGKYHSASMYSYDDIAQLGDDMFVLGHLHIDQGITTSHVGGRNVTYINVGAVSRGSLADDNTTRAPKIGYVEVSKINGAVSVLAKSVRLKVKPAEEVFDLESHEKERKKHEEAEAFVEKLRAEESGQNALERIDSVITSMGLDKAVLGSVTHYLTEADLLLKGGAK